MFGSGVECWAVAEFYRSLNIEADSDVCESARSFNYICGCSDTLGYAGANTKTKQVALAWLPRVGAILSILVRDTLLHISRVCVPYLVDFQYPSKCYCNFRPLSTVDVFYFSHP